MGKSGELLFRLGLVGKGIDSVFEVVGGIMLTMPTKLARWVTLVSQHEVYKHHLALAGKLDHLAVTVTEKAQIGEAVYLMIHGLAKVVLILAIVAGKRWGYIGFVVVLSFFTLIELGRALTARETVTGIFGLVDAFVVWLIFREYKQRFPKDAKTQTEPLVQAESA